ncbi:arylamine N-acetyltransferase family protein [Paraburkholderia aspalathi]|uniref:arylamine N-acetyltransferase family protein n=1 Tax=Paraburkholderia aspalathi TaxID=1324617 RepID=UPI0038B98ED6
MFDERLLDKYLQRIGAERPKLADAEALRYLQERHVLSVPFENLAFHLGEPVPHSVEAIKKVVYGHRGGSCFELNSAFALLLRAFGFQVNFLLGRIYRGKILSKQLGHLALWVETGGMPVSGDAPGAAVEAEENRQAWLVDVGQGNNSRTPLRFDLRTPQADAHGEYLLSDASEGDIDVSRDGAPLYRLELRPRDLDFCAPLVWWYRTAPESPFATRLMCVLPTEKGRVSLAGDLLMREENDRQIKERLASDEDLRKAYKTWFGIVLDRLPPLPERRLVQK